VEFSDLILVMIPKHINSLLKYVHSIHLQLKMKPLNHDLSIQFRLKNSSISALVTLSRSPPTHPISSSQGFRSLRKASPFLFPSPLHLSETSSILIQFPLITRLRIGIYIPDPADDSWPTSQTTSRCDCSCALLG
jgi:hypothetical protein